MRKGSNPNRQFAKPAPSPVPSPPKKTADDFLADVEKAWPETLALNAVRAKYARAEMNAYMQAGFTEDQALQLVCARIKPV